MQRCTTVTLLAASSRTDLVDDEDDDDEDVVVVVASFSALDVVEIKEKSLSSLQSSPNRCRR